MGLFRRPTATQERSLSYQDVWGSGGPEPILGQGVAGMLSLIPLFAAHRLIIDQFATTPWHAYREGADGSPNRIPKQPLIVRKPSATGRGVVTWKGQCVASLLSRGNAYGMVTSRDGVGTPTSSVWLDPAQVTVDESGVLPRYYWHARELDLRDVIHIPWIVQPEKWVGLSPLGAFKTLYEMGAAAQISARDWFVNGSIPGGILQNQKQKIEQPVADTMKDRFKAAVTGHDVLVIGNDWDYETIGVPANEARFIETLKLTATQIATIYGIPPERIGGETGSSMTYATVEGNAIDLQTSTMRPWYVRVEEAFSELLPQPQYIKFNTDAMIRTDLLTRMTAHETQMRLGLETQDEARAVEDKPPLTPEQKAEWLATLAAAKPTAPTKESRVL